MANHTYHYFGAYLTIKVHDKSITDVNELLPEEFEDALAPITPEQLYASGTIIAAGNTDKPSGDWLHLGPWTYEGEPYMKAFPTSGQLDHMYNEIEQNYADVIGLLRQSSDVISVEVGAGYVINAEY